MSALCFIRDGEPIGTKNWSRSQKPSGIGEGRVDRRTREFGRNSCITIRLAMRRGSSFAASCWVDIALHRSLVLATAAEGAASSIISAARTNMIASPVRHRNGSS
jgi:hypothetical protein